MVWYDWQGRAWTTDKDGNLLERRPALDRD